MRAAPLVPSLVAATLALAACQRDAASPEAPSAAEPAPPAAEAQDAPHAFAPEITAADFARHVQVLASDAFEGRAPGSAGEEKTVENLTEQFMRIGLKPGNGDSYVQTVPMVQTTADPSTTLAITADGKPRTLAFGTDMVIGTRTGEEEVALKDAPLVFVGYGVNAPERDWNDYAGVDVKDKVVVMLVNDPGFHDGNEALFDGKAMTYYGRWTYKYEEAARQGAAGALIIHDDAGASYGWDVVRNSWSGAQFDLPAKDDPEPRLPMQGWITGEQARALMSATGHDLDALYKAAGKPGFKAIPLDATASTVLKSRIEEKTSRNVLARLPGTRRPDETVVYMAHWDHLGNHGHDGDAPPQPGEDTIYNGAVDNATGVAGILEIAEAFAHQTPPPERSLLFLAVTLEESGLLGSQYYVAHPTVPLEKIAGVINLDAMPVTGKSRDMTVIGLGNSEMDDLLEPFASAQQRVLRAESSPESGFYFRSDHFNFVKAGVPALYAKGGNDLLEGGAQAGARAQAEYRDKHYHQPGDEFDPAWNLEGVMQDLEALYGVGRELAGTDRWPRFREGNAFRAAQDRLRGGR